MAPAASPVPHRIHKRSKLRQISHFLGKSLLIPRTGESHVPLATPAGQMGLTFLGHSGFLVELGGQMLAIDPVLSNWLVLVRRLRKPGVAAKDFPAVDWVLITHAHMDHLDRRSLRMISSRSRELTGRAPGIVLPAGTADLIADLGFARVIEMQRWQTISLGATRVTHTPAKHWGARMLHDHHRGFGGYVLENGDHSLYHSGDTAYFDGFREIGQRLHPRIALLPIGAYSPDNFRGVHTSPEDALQGFVDLGAEQMVPMHYGTFRLSYEPMDEPVPRLLAAAESAGIASKVRVLQEGRTGFFGQAEEPSSTEEVEAYNSTLPLTHSIRNPSVSEIEAALDEHGFSRARKTLHTGASSAAEAAVR